MKYKINNNDNVSNTTGKNVVNSKRQKKIKSNERYVINLKKNKKKRILLFSLYLLAFGATTVTTILLLYTNTTINSSQFNPNANNKLWEEYYQKHHHNTTPISLDTTNDYFKKPENIIIFNVIKKDNDNGNIDFRSVLNSIDQNLQKVKIENDIDNDNPDPKLLPINFFANVNYNPAVKFTVGNNKTPITNNSFILPKKFNKPKKYILNMTTNDQAPIFGINNTNVNIQINIKIKNKIAINISDLPLTFPTKIISINEPQYATIDQIKDKWLVPEIQNKFDVVLRNALNIKQEKKKLKNYYKIEFEDSSTTRDFTKSVAVKFTITSLDNNPWKFTGTKECTINVKNDKANLNSMKELTSEIEEQYNNDNNNFQIRLDNQKDEDGNYINADSKLSPENVKFVNKQVIISIQEICQSYFQKNYPDLNIEPSDYTIVTDLKAGDDIFNHKLGKNIAITIKAITSSYKLSGNLNAKAIIHGHNKNNITESYTSSDNFGLNGIWLKDGRDANILQEGQHFYEQDNLLNNWITSKESLLNTVINNSYQPVANSFSGTFTMNCQLDKEQKNRSMTADISKDITGGKATNFWDLITNTKSIYLETDVSTTSGWSVENVKLIFTNREAEPDQDNTLYTFDLSSKFASITVSERATLTFNDFNFKFNYQLES
ncbi:hypothetical protein [Spiroplasma endosymbiont of Polydrusus pterygomalis]|uniref:hypothetical protein n=1 Tax=Spiroplasma endosymbiont of Polydrusus pterygomalis TaxID=3139327 RepID=UPI003CCACA1A